MSNPHNVPEMTYEQATEYFEGKIDRLTTKLMASRTEKIRARLIKQIADCVGIRDHLKDLISGATTETVRFDEDGYIPRT